MYWIRRPGARSISPRRNRGCSFTPAIFSTERSREKQVTSTNTARPWCSRHSISPTRQTTQVFLPPLFDQISNTTRGPCFRLASKAPESDPYHRLIDPRDLLTKL